MRLHHRTSIIALAVVCLAAACSSGSHHATPTTQSRFAPTPPSTELARPSTSTTDSRFAPDASAFLVIRPASQASINAAIDRGITSSGVEGLIDRGSLRVQASPGHFAIVQLTFQNNSGTMYEDAAVYLLDDSGQPANEMQPSTCLGPYGNTPAYEEEGCYDNAKLTLKLPRGNYIITLDSIAKPFHITVT